MPRRILSSVLCAACLASPLSASALAFERSASVAVLGQTLDFRIPITLQGGESITPECVSVEVVHGESPLQRQFVRYTLDAAAAPGAVLRVRTLVPIEEPVVQINVGIGCPPRMSRRYIAFADPPSVRFAQDGAQSLSGSSPPTAGPAEALAMPPERALRPGPTRESAAAAASSAYRARPSTQAQLPLRLSATAAVPPGRRNVGGGRLVLEPLAPHLKLDIDEPLFMGAAAPAPVAESAAAASDATPADLERVHALERSVTQLRLENQASRANAEQFQARLRLAQDDARWLPWLFALLALCLLALAALAWRLRRPAKPAQWWTGEADAQAAQALPAADVVQPVPAAEPDAEFEPEPPLHVQATLPPEDIDWPAAVRDAQMMQVIEEAPMDLTPVDLPLAEEQPAAPAIEAPAAPHEAAVDELLDLEQQADFFTALGQEEAAIDLLAGHLQHTPASGPLPYVQLLDSYRRREDRSAYELMRIRFNRRFDAQVPPWDVAPPPSRTLEDYPLIVQSLQAVWPRPASAMANLEAMLLHRDKRSDLLDLPAYRDLLMLYALARDLAQQDGGDDARSDVDVLLPLGAEPDLDIKLN